MTGLVAAFGSGAMTNSIADLGEADVVLVIGSNTTEAHPIIGIELKKAARRGTKLFVADPREVRLTRHAERWLPVAPGANIAFLNAMMRVILDEGLEDRGFVAERTEGFERLEEMLRSVDLEDAAATCGVPLEHIREAAIAYATADAASIVYSMGITQHTTGTAQVRAIADLAMLTGNVGRPGTGVNPLRGQNNVQGACDLACLPNCLPGYRYLGSGSAVAEVCDFWGSDKALPDAPGLTVVEMMDAAAKGELRALYVMGENPVLSDPDQAHVLEALENLEFLVVQDIFLTETAQLADVVLPAATYLEKTGTFTNTDRHVQLVTKVVDAPGDALPDSEIIGRIADAMGLNMDYASPAAIMDEIAEITPQYAGITYERLRSEGGLQWPCPAESHPGTPVLHAEGFARGRGAFAGASYAAATESSAGERPFVLTTGRDLWHFHTNTMTSRAEGLAQLDPASYVSMNAEDAAGIGVCHGDRVIVESKHGSVETTVRTSGVRKPRPGVVYMPFHFGDAPANRLTGGELDPSSKIPGLKATPVSIRRAG